MTRLTDLDVKRFSQKYWPRFRKNFRENGVENFRENCSKIAKILIENDRKFSRNLRENRVSRFSLETLFLILFAYENMFLVGHYKKHIKKVYN